MNRGIGFTVPEIADFEVRRSLILMTKRTIRKTSDTDKVQWARECLRNLDEMTRTIDYIPLSTDIMHTASEMWAQARKKGVPTAHNLELDCDVILAAQAIKRSGATEQVIIATGNIGHLTRYNTPTVTAKSWKDI